MVLRASGRGARRRRTEKKKKRSRPGLLVLSSLRALDDTGDTILEGIVLKRAGVLLYVE